MQTSAAAVRCGWLQKKSPKWPNPMQRRYFRLTADELSYYRDDQTDEQKGIIPLAALVEVEQHDNALVLTLEHAVRVYYVEATGTDEATQWRHAILEAREADAETREAVRSNLISQESVATFLRESDERAGRSATSSGNSAERATKFADGTGSGLQNDSVMKG